MYRCDECKRVFEHPAKDKEYHPEVGESEEWHLCPCCGSVDFAEVHMDSKQEEWVPLGEEFTADTKSELWERFDEIVAEFAETDREKTAVYEELDNYLEYRR